MGSIIVEDNKSPLDTPLWTDTEMNTVTTKHLSWNQRQYVEFQESGTIKLVPDENGFSINDNLLTVNTILTGNEELVLTALPGITTLGATTYVHFSGINYEQFFEMSEIHNINFECKEINLKSTQSVLCVFDNQKLIN
ncbi:hypothetical protein [Moritella sp. F3]|uniref:hypothetical protein n=1 Tax=Moritella sp. F3 TaxID=2718882 RepID=UPI0018E0F0AB|nr:hypothetical protein [Moritella sp. F3]